MTTRRATPRIIVSVAVVAAAMLHGLSAMAAAPAVPADFDTYKKTALAQYDARISALMTKHADDPAMKSFRARLALVDEVAGKIVAGFQAAKLQSLDAVLEGPKAAPAKPASGPASAVAMATANPAAFDILDLYGESFAEGLELPAVTGDDLALLREYYDAVARAAGAYVAERGRAIAAIDPKAAPNILQLCLSMRFLHIPDDRWSAEEVQGLPEWMRKPEHVASMEAMALRARRPFTAFQFATYREKIRPGSVASPGDYLAYADLRAAAHANEDREYHTAIQCMKACVGVLEERKDFQAALTQRIELVQLMEKLGHPALAADEMKAGLDRTPPSDLWGKAATLRLRFLYEAAKFDLVTQEAAGFESNEACKPYLPQVLYVAWVAYRRTGKNDQAADEQKKFLEKFGKHPLAADMYFASAMEALAAGNYTEARRLLETVKIDYPDSRLQPKVTDVLQRLKAAEK